MYTVVLPVLFSEAVVITSGIRSSETVDAVMTGYAQNGLHTLVIHPQKSPLDAV
jgi:hypothetical protein